MIELIRGNDSTPVDDVRRQEIPSRLAIEKGMLPDEAITVSQIAGGNGIQIKHTDGLSSIYNKETGLYEEVLDTVARGNIIVNRNQLDIPLDIDTNILPYIMINMIPEYFNKQFGDLKEKAVLIINGIQYNYGINNWFVIDVQEINGYNQLVVQWLGNDLFNIEVTDSIILRI